MEYRSQVGQDKWVCEFFRNKRNGYFLDIGANDGVWISNTYYMEKELGWDGICIEAGLTPFLELKKNRKCICVNKFVSDKNGVTDFAEINYNRTIAPGRFEIEEIRLDTLMGQYIIPDIIDYVSIDTDGNEYEILKKFPFNKHKVILWTIEHNYYLRKEPKEAIKKIMNKHGYIIAIENVEDDGFIFEDWYIHKDYAIT